MPPPTATHTLRSSPLFLTLFFLTFPLFPHFLTSSLVLLTHSDTPLSSLSSDIPLFLSPLLCLSLSLSLSPPSTPSPPLSSPSEGAPQWAIARGGSACWRNTASCSQ